MEILAYILLFIVAVVFVGAILPVIGIALVGIVLMHGLGVLPVTIKRKGVLIGRIVKFKWVPVR